MSTAEDGNMKKCVAVSLERLPCAQDRECILSACAHLAARAEDPMEIIALSSMAHALLTEANVKHVSFHLHPPAHYDEASFAKKLTMVVGNLPETWEQSASSFAPAFYHSVASRGLLFSKVTCILVEGYYPLLFQAGAVPESKSKWVNARSLEYLAAHSQRMADSILIHSHLGPKPQRVMVVGGGGREHAIAWKLSQSSHVREVLVLPGNGGTAGMPKIRNLAGNISDLANVVKLAQTNEVDFAVVGPEQPLVDGLTDRLAEVGIPCFGPSARAARLEGSKAFSKDFMQRHGIPTARFRNFTDLDLAVAHLESIDYPVVIKASGLAAGKGVVLPETAEEGVAELRAMMAEKRFGAAGEEVVIEERLFGEEISVMAFCDGRKAVLMPAAQDHKRIFDGDRGPNTGGMGTIAPAPIFSSPRLREQVFHAIDTTLAAARREGFPFVGVLFTGFMVTEEGAKVLEYNCRFGDPETQSVLPLLKSDLFEVMRSCVLGDVGSGVAVAWEDALAACAVMTASEGYPGKYEKGREIVGLDKVVGRGDQVFHSGTKEVDGKVITSGGRVLAVSAVRQTLQEALNAAYEVVRHVVKFDGMQFRSDIGAKSLRPPLKLGVLGSTRGTDLQYIIDAISCGWVNAEVSVVCSNKASAYILERAKNHKLEAVHISSKGLERAEYDSKVSDVLEEHDVGLVLLIGYMRILSDEFVRKWKGRVLNVHPSLLPEFAGGMDLDVHQAVIDAGKTTTGCTIHFVTEVVDGGPIAVQRRCHVEPSDTSESLKKKVQALEGPAYVRAINSFINGELDSIR